MRIDLFLISLIMFSAIVVTGTYMIDDVNTNYGLDLSKDDFNETYNVINDMYPIVDTMENKTLDVDIAGGGESWESMTKGTYSTARGVKNTFSLFGSMLNAISKTLKLPKYLVQFLLLAITISIVWAVVYMVMRFKP